jgi:hypothetical protein
VRISFATAHKHRSQASLSDGADPRHGACRHAQRVTYPERVTPNRRGSGRFRSVDSPRVEP